MQQPIFVVYDPVKSFSESMFFHNMYIHLFHVQVPRNSKSLKTRQHSKEDTAQGLMHKLPLYLRREQQTRLAARQES